MGGLSSGPPAQHDAQRCERGRGAQRRIDPGEGRNGCGPFVAGLHLDAAELRQEGGKRRGQTVAQDLGSGRVALSNRMSGQLFRSLRSSLASSVLEATPSLGKALWRW
ncbi:hypothetical protein GCM10022419_116400 [Nonomuraea rosea]|uniref:Uncharacterized protein n=1 Tax=Nonomuraea rosea TaxID=638574 RepID=A0ABP6ZM19_9ACTN